MGEKLTQTQFSGQVSGVNLLNAIIHLVEDVKSTAGIAPRSTLAIVAEKFGYKLVRSEPNETMSASLSEKTANEEE